MRKRWKRDGGSAAPSRTAAIGGTRVARSAGRRLAISVTTIADEQRDAIVRVLDHHRVRRQRRPSFSNSHIRPGQAEAEEEADDRSDHAHDRSASTMIEPSTWTREAPSVRSVANSRVRWAIVIESELTITKLPTKSAMPAKASRKSWKVEMLDEVSEDCFAASA